MDPTYPLIPIISILCGILPLLPLPWLVAHWNTGAWMYALWVSSGCFIHGINEIVWKDNVNDVAPIWCDISTRFYVGKSVAIPAASLAITRRIYLMFSLRCPLSGSRAEKRRTVLLDLGLTLGLPILQMIVYYIVQMRRYTILEEFGCLPSVFNAWPAFLLMYSWPLIIGSISCTFCVRIVRTYLQRRRNISKMDAAASFGRYYRALALGCVDAIFTVPISAFLFVQNGILRDSIESYNWTDAHRDFFRIGMSPSEEWSMEGRWRRFGFHWNVWASPACAVIFFCFFGLTEEAREGYKAVFVTILRLLGFRCHDKQVAPSSNPLDVSQFRAAPTERTMNFGDRNSLFSGTLLSESVFGSDDLERMESERTLDTMEEMEYELPPIGKAALMPLGLRSSMIDQV